MGQIRVGETNQRSHANTTSVDSVVPSSQWRLSIYIGPLSRLPSSALPSFCRISHTRSTGNANHCSSFRLSMKKVFMISFMEMITSSFHRLEVIDMGFFTNTRHIFVQSIRKDMVKRNV